MKMDLKSMLFKKFTILSITFLMLFAANSGMSSESDATIRITSPLISYDNGFKVSVLNHCKERGFIRPINPTRRKCTVLGTDIESDDWSCSVDNTIELFLKMPIFYFHIIDLGHERYFHKIHFEKINNHIITEVDLDDEGNPILLTRRTYKYKIPKCQVNMIAKSNEPFVERTASPQETMVYTALYQKHFSVIDLEKFSMKDVKDGRDSVYSSLGSDGVAKLSYNSPNCHHGHFINVDADQIYEDILAAYNYGGEGSGSGRYFGGEGSGSGLVKINLHLPQHEFRDLRFKANAYEIMMDIKPRYYKYLVEGASIPDSIAKIKCSKGGDDGK
jgi:hypothetical protein